MKKYLQFHKYIKYGKIKTEKQDWKDQGHGKGTDSGKI